MNRSAFWVIVGGFFFLGLLIYGASLSNGFVRFDDGLLIYENAAIRGVSLANLKTIFTRYDPELYIPLTLLSYQMDYMISGINPSWYHLHSLLLHISNALLVTWFICLLGNKKWAAVLTGVLFLVHPLNTEAVAWASGRKDVLSLLWMLISLNLFIRYKEGEPKLYRWSIIAFTLGLLAKATVITLPAVIILIGIYKGWQFDRTFWKHLVPYGVLMGIFAVIAYFGKTGVIDSSTTLEKMIIAPFSTIFYIQKLLIPTGLAVIYPLTGSITLLSARFFFPILLCAVLLIIGLRSRNRHRDVFFGLVFFAVTLLPSLLNVSKGGFLYFASDRYAYVPSIGLLYLLACSAYWLWQRAPQFASAMTGIVLIVLSVLSMQQSLVWANSETLFTHNLQHYPSAHTAHNNLGNIYRSQGNTNAAIESYAESVRLSTQHGRGNSAVYERSKILSNLASAYRVQGDTTLALQTLTEAEELNAKNPHLFLQRGIVLGVLGQYVEAEAAYRKAIELYPLFTTAKINLASMLVNLGRSRDAIVLLEDATEENPFYAQAFYNLGVAYRKNERNRESLEAYEAAIALQPAFVAARINAGILYAERRKIDLAIEQFTEVLRYDPQNARALSALQQLQ